MINNPLPQGDRTVTMIISNILNATIASPSNAVLTIKDTTFSPGQLSFASDELLRERRRRDGARHGHPHRRFLGFGIRVLLHDAAHRDPRRQLHLGQQ